MSGTKVVITNGELMPLAEALAALGKEKFGVAFSFQLKRLIAALKMAIDVYGEARNEIIEEYAKRNADGTKKMSEDQTIVEMNDGWVPKMAELNKISAARLTPIIASELVKECDKINVGVSGQLLADLGPLLIDDMDGSEEMAVPSTPAPARVNGTAEILPERAAVMG